MVISGKSPSVAIREGFFQVISIITCTGFASSDFIFWPLPGLILLFLLMFAGGSTGSTSGGIKMARHLVMLKNIKMVLSRLNHPKTVQLVKLNGNQIDQRTNISIISFIMLYLFVFSLGTVIITLVGSDPVTSASSVATCLAGIGPGLGTVGPMSNYSAMPVISKIILSIVMIIGRLEIIPVLALFSKSFWKL
jgi:trk system potassium uptake protein TrkH